MTPAELCFSVEIFVSFFVIYVFDSLLYVLTVDKHGKILTLIVKKKLLVDV